MFFSSLLFIYFFLPLNLLFYACISDIKKKNVCVLIFSLIFYAWMSPLYLILLSALALVSYIGARLVGFYRTNAKAKAKAVLVVYLCITLGVLGYFKYLGFFCSIINSVAHVFGTIPSVVLPVGISFYTFQLISYVADVYRGDVEADKKYSNVLLYAALFHQCIAGPIVRYKDIANDLKERKTSIRAMDEGISRFCVGLAKKALLANTCASIVEKVLPENLMECGDITIVAAWLGGLLYMLNIYLDFSAYSDMAIGLGRMTGFYYKENFNYPYTAVSITDFWRRWHISLGTFFRDYVYIPLGGNRKGKARQLLNMFIVWGLTGLWHGANYNFVLWGLYYFVFLAAEKLVLLKVFSKLPKVVGAVVTRVYTLLVVFVGWMIFRFTDMASMTKAMRALIGLDGNRFTNFEINTVFLNNILFIIICIVAATPLVKNVAEWFRRKAVNGEEMSSMNIYNVLNTALPVLLLLLSTIALIGDSYNPFIYFRF